MTNARNCKVGDRVKTDYDKKHSGITEHVIVGKKKMLSQSGIGFQVDPPLRRRRHDTWIDADWFKETTND